MKHLFYIILLVLTFTACQRRTKEKKESCITGVWKYESIIRTAQTGTNIDTTYQYPLVDEQTLQFYDVFQEDSILVSYTILDDSVISERPYKYKISNDSIFVTNSIHSTATHIAELTDSILIMDLTIIQKDTANLLSTVSRRCELPKLLKKK